MISEDSNRNQSQQDSLPDSRRMDCYKPVWFVNSLRLLILAGIGLGTLSVWFRYFIFTDGTVYATLGRNLAEGVGLQYCGAIHLFYPPGYPIAIAMLYGILRNAELAGHLVSCFAYIGTIILTARLAWSLRPSPLFTLSAVFLVVFHPYFILNASYVMSESLFACVVLASALCSWKLAQSIHSPRWLWGVWGFLGGYAYLIRADGIVYWPLQALFLGYVYRKQWRIFFPYVFVSAFLFVFVIFPYMFLIKQETHHWQLSTKTAILLEFSRMKMQDGSARGETQQTSQLAEDGKTFALDHAQETLSSFLLGHPREALDRILWNWGRLLRRHGLVFSWMTVPLFLALIGILKRRIFSRQAAFLLLHVSPMLLFSVFYVDERFILAFIPFFAMAYAIAMEWGLERLRGISMKKVLQVGVPIVLVLVVILGTMFSSRLQRVSSRIFPSNLPLEHKSLGLWMQKNLTITPTTRITHRNPWVSFYAGGCHRRTPDFDLHLSEEERAHRLVQWCQEWGIEYVVVDERMTLPNMPALVFLLEPQEKNFPGLKLIKTVEGSFPKILLYSVQLN